MGAAGVIIALFIALTLGVSWISSDKERTKLEGKIVDERTVKSSLELDIVNARRRSARDAEKIAELNEQLKNETAERQRLERELEYEQRQKRIAEEQGFSPDIAKEREKIREELETKSKEDIAKLESKLFAAEEARKKAETEWTQASLKASKARDLENENIRLKLSGAQNSIDKAASAGLISASLKKDLESNLLAAFSILAVSKAKQQETQELVARSGKEVEAAGQEIPVDKGAKSKTAEDFKQRIANLESRLVTIKDDKKVIDERWAVAMAAIVKMEETTQKIETALKGPSEKGADVNIKEKEESAKLQADLETLRQARENMRSAMDKVKNAIENSMEAETKMVLAEATQTTEVMSKMFGDAQIKAELTRMDRAGKDKAVDSGELKEEKIKVLDRKLEELNMLAKTVLKAEPVQVERIRDNLANMPFDVYVVKRGDTLSEISAKGEVYGKASMWPLLYKYNFYYMTSPDVIEPDTALLVRRDFTKKDVKDAVKKTNTRGPWKGQKGHLKAWILDWLK